MHLVSWEVIKQTLSEGGLQIHDPGLANLELGGKLIGKLYKDKNHPVYRIFRMKYLKGRSLRNITSANTSSGSGVWNSYRKCFDFFNLQLYRTPGNGKKIYLWEDRIFGNKVTQLVEI